MPTSNADLRVTGKGEMADILKAFAGVGLQLQKMEGRLDEVQKEAKKTSQSISNGFKKVGDKIGSQFRRIAGIAVAALGTAGVVGTFKKAIGSAQSFEFELRKVGTLLRGDATKSLGEYRKALLDLSKQTGESVTTLSKGLFDVVSASVRGTESIKGSLGLLTASSRAAIAGFTDTATAVDVMTTVLNSYEQSTEDAVTVSDKLVTVARLGKTNLGEMAPELGKVTKVAASAGISLDELGGAVVQLTKSGRRINFAMTDMRAIINGLLKPTKDLQALFERTGYASGEAALKARGFTGVMQMIGEETGGSTQQLLKFIPQQEAIAGASILAAKNVDGLREAIDEIGNSAGATDEAYAKMADTFDKRAARLKAKVNVLFIRLGTEILPIVLEKLQGLEEWIDKNSDEIVQFARDVFDAIVDLFKFIREWGPAAATAMAGLWAVGKISAFITMVKSASVALAGFKTAWTTLSLVMMANPIVLTIAAITAVIAALTYAVKTLIDAWDELIGYFKQSVYEQFGKPMEKKLAKQIGGMSAGGREAMLSALEAREPEMGGRVRSMVELQEQADAAAYARLVEEMDMAMGVSRPRAALPDVGGAASALLGGFGGAGAGGAGAAAGAGVSDKLKKQWKQAEEYLRQLRIETADKLQQIDLKHAEERRQVAQMKFRSAKDKQEALARVDEKWQKKKKEYIDDQIEAEEAAAKKRAAIEEESRKESLEVARKKKGWIDSIDKSFIQAQENYFDMREEAARRALEFEKRAADTFMEKFKAVGKAVGSVLLDAVNVVADEIDSIFGGIYRKAYNQIKKLVSLAIESAARGEKRLVLEEATRARIEEEMGRPLTEREARARATAYTPGQLSELERQGRIGEYRVVGAETPADRMSGVLTTMQEWWSNLADNLGPILDWLADTAVPALIDKIAQEAPKIISVLNESWKNTLPKIVDLFADYLDDVLDQIPSIAEAFTQGIVNLLERLMKRLPDILSAVFSFLTQSFASLVKTIINLIVSGIPKIVGQLVKSLPMIVKELVEELATELLPAVAKAIVDAISNVAGPSKSKGANLGLAVATGGLSMFFHEGGMIDRLHKTGMVLGDALRAHQGMYVSPKLASDEVPIIAQTGEAVLSREGVATAGGRDGIDRLNRGEARRGSSQVNNVTVNTEYLFPEAAADVIDSLQQSLMRKGRGTLVDALRGDKVTGFEPKI